MSDKFTKGQRSIPATWLNSVDDANTAIRGMSSGGGLVQDQTPTGMALSLDFELIRKKIAKIPGGGIYCRLTGVGQNDGTYQSWELMETNPDDPDSLRVSQMEDAVSGDSQHILVEKNGIWPLQYTGQGVDSDPANPDTTTIVYCDEFFIDDTDRNNPVAYYYFDAPDTHITTGAINLHEGFTDTVEPDSWDATHSTTRTPCKLYLWKTYFEQTGDDCTIKEFSYYALLTPNKGILYVSEGTLEGEMSWTGASSP